MGSPVNREELRRLQKAARDNNKAKLGDWIRQFEHQLDTILRKDYEQAYQNEVQSTVENTLIAVAYTALFSEENYVDKENIGDYMADLFSTLDMYRTGEYTPQEYKDILKENGVTIDEYDYDGPYKRFLNIFDRDLVRFLKSQHRKIVTICGSSKFKDEILQANQDLTLQGYMVFIDGVFAHSDNVELFDEEKKQLDDLHKEKILISDAIYVVNKDGYIGESTKSEIEFAKEHNKEIMYLEPIN